ncbi:MAG TPA: winged helix-turn-helix domain-containing protein [Solirubrobacteraceae bacterium]|nr:winged helix-turn-helix domain-containing protein [Solirubrobacteraceae bacterium]
MSGTLRALVDRQAPALVGRDREHALLGELLDDGGPVVAHVHGLAGVGKSALLRAFAVAARARGAATLELDGHAVYPTQGAFLAAVAGEDAEDEPPSLQAAVAALGARGEQVVLLVDGYELLHALDAWLCRSFVPELPGHVRVVLGGREVPAQHWRATYAPALRIIELDNLAPEDALGLLRTTGVDERTATRINAVARGHPLSLELAAGALRDRPGLAIESIAVGTVGEQLTRIYLDGLDPATRRALDAASLTRRTTLSVLEAMLPDDPPADAFDRLRRLSFVALGPDGLVVHDTVREATAALLRASNPDAYWRLRAAAWSRLRTELRGAPRRDLRRYTADMLYLIEHEAVREAFFPPAVGEQAVTPAAAEDEPQIEALADRYLSADEAQLARAWWASAPEGFLVARNQRGVPKAFACLVEPHQVGARVLDRDPLASRWRAHLRREPVPRGQRTLFLRFFAGRKPWSPALSALLLDATRIYMEMRPELRRVYAPAADLVGADASCAMAMGYLPMDGDPESVCVDFGPASVDGWLDELGERELQVMADDGGVEPDGLTRLEAEVLAYLQRHAGEPVERAALLRDVWGYDWTGGSNVVEVVISSLRRKLGDRGSAIKTVRGVGYRLEPLS